MKNIFRKLATRISIWAGSPLVFVSAIFIILIWALSGPAAGYSDTWQLVINTGTTIITFLMVFLIQNTQNRDGRAVQLKLDELIRSSKMARNSFVSLEDITDEELQQITEEFRKLHEKLPHTHAVHKLNEKLEHEHAKRQYVKSAFNQVVGVVTDPFGVVRARSDKK